MMGRRAAGVTLKFDVAPVLTLPFFVVAGQVEWAETSTPPPPFVFKNAMVH